MRLVATLFFALAYSPFLAYADTLAGSTEGVSTNTTTSYIGQSFTVVGSGSYSDITFSYYTASLTPYAMGTGFLFGSIYNGTPSEFNEADTGYLGEASAAGGAYSFGSSLDLLAGNTYFFYENALIPGGVVTGDSSYSGNAFFSLSESDAYSESSSANFIVSGTNLTPEPSSLVLLGTGILAGIGIARRRLGA